MGKIQIYRVSTRFLKMLGIIESDIGYAGKYGQISKDGFDRK